MIFLTDDIITQYYYNDVKVPKVIYFVINRYMIAMNNR